VILTGHVEKLINNQAIHFRILEKKKERGYNKLLHTPIEQGTSKKTTQNSSTTDCNDDHAV
jgi:hypothetical protein